MAYIYMYPYIPMNVYIYNYFPYGSINIPMDPYIYIYVSLWIMDPYISKYFSGRFGHLWGQVPIWIHRDDLSG